MNIKILGGGCKNCDNLMDNVKKVTAELNITAEISKVSEYADIAAYGVMSTPALVIDEEVISYGKVNSVDELTKIFKERA